MFSRLQRELVCPADASRHLHGHKQRDHRTERDCETGESFNEERVGEHHQVDKLSQRRLPTRKMKTDNESQVTHDKKNRDQRGYGKRYVD